MPSNTTTNTIRINLNGYEQFTSIINDNINSNKKIVINYINFHSFNLAITKDKVNNLLNSFNYNFADGTGIWLGLKLFNMKNFKRFNLTDFGFDLMKKCEQKNWKIFFFGSHKTTLNSAQQNLFNFFPKLKIVGMADGYESYLNSDLPEIINKVNPDILLVGLGSLKQEKWIYENRDKINARIILSVGDLFNYFAGKKHRGNKLIQRLGLEWTIRLFYSPSKYFKRYILGIPKYISLLIEFKIKGINPFASN